jgi:predicted transport protein
MLITKDEIEKLIDEKLNEKEKEYYKKYIAYMIENNFFELWYFLKHKNLFFRYMK